MLLRTTKKNQRFIALGVKIMSNYEDNKMAFLNRKKDIMDVCQKLYLEVSENVELLNQLIKSATTETEKMDYVEMITGEDAAFMNRLLHSLRFVFDPNDIQIRQELIDTINVYEFEETIKKRRR